MQEDKHDDNYDDNNDNYDDNYNDNHSDKTKECINFTIVVNINEERIKFVDEAPTNARQQQPQCTFRLATVEDVNTVIKEFNPFNSDWIQVKKNQYYVVKARPGKDEEQLQFQEIAQIVLTNGTFRVKEVAQPPNTLFMTRKKKEERDEMQKKIREIAYNTSTEDNKQVLVFAEDSVYTSMSQEVQKKCSWKDHAFEIDVKKRSIRFVKQKDSVAILSVYKDMDSPQELAIRIDPTIAEDNNKVALLERHCFYILCVRRGAEDVPVIMFKITDKTAIMRELSSKQTKPVALKLEKA